MDSPAKLTSLSGDRDHSHWTRKQGPLGKWDLFYLKWETQLYCDLKNKKVFLSSLQTQSGWPKSVEQLCSVSHSEIQGPENHCRTIPSIIKAELPPVCALAWWGTSQCVKAWAWKWQTPLPSLGEKSAKGPHSGDVVHTWVAVSHYNSAALDLEEEKKGALWANSWLTQDPMSRRGKWFF